MTHYQKWFLVLCSVITLAYAQSNHLLIKHADKAKYDKNTEIVTGYGNVELLYNDTKITSQNVTLKLKDNKILFPNNVTVYMDQRILRANHLFGSKNLSNLTFYNIQSTFDNHALIVAERGMRMGDTFYFYNTEITFCNLCQIAVTNDNIIPIFHSPRVVYHQKEDLYQFYQNTIYISRFPVLYLPYLSGYGPKVKRKSGFLIGMVSFYSKLGASFLLPYFINISENQDLFINTRLLSNAGIMMGTKYRWETTYNNLMLAGDYIYTTPQLVYTDSKSKQHPDRYITRLTDNMYLPYTWQVEVALSYLSDPNYLNDFPFYNTEVASNNYIKSYVAITQNTLSSYTTLRANVYQTLYSQLGTVTTADIIANYQYLTDKILGGYFVYTMVINSNVYGQNNSNNSLSTDLLYNYVKTLGPILTKTSFESNIGSVLITYNTKQTLDIKAFNLKTLWNNSLSEDISLPLQSKYFSQFSFIQGPRIYGIYYLKSHRLLNPDVTLPILSGNNLLFNSTTLVGNNVFTQPRIDVGYNFSVFTENSNTNVFFGKSIFFNDSYKKYIFNFKNNKSQIPTFAQVNYTYNTFGIQHTEYFDSKMHSLQNNTILQYNYSTTFQINTIYTHGYYINTTNTTADANFGTKRNELQATMSVSPLPHWTFTVARINSLINSKVERTNFSFTFDNDCFMFNTNLSINPLTLNKYAITFSFAIRPIFYYSSGSSNINFSKNSNEYL